MGRGRAPRNNFKILSPESLSLCGHGGSSVTDRSESWVFGITTFPHAGCSAASRTNLFILVADDAAPTRGALACVFIHQPTRRSRPWVKISTGKDAAKNAKPAPPALRQKTEGAPFLELARNTVARVAEVGQDQGPKIEISE